VIVWTLAIACLLGSLVATKATVIAALAVSALGVRGLGATLLVQVIHDFAPLLVCALTGLFFSPAHRGSTQGFTFASALLLACTEPLFSARTDIVLASWQIPRIVSRLSALLFSVTFSSYLDLLSERPAGTFRKLLRGAANNITFGLVWLAAQLVNLLTFRRFAPKVLQWPHRAIGLPRSARRA
jgi:hypothetical protein